MLIPRTELEWRLRQLAVLGFDAFTVYYEPRPGLPLVYGCTRGDLALELSLVDYDPAGNPFFVVRTDDAAVAISVPADLFRWPPTVIDGVSIHTLSPLALVHVRAGASATRAFGPERPGKDDVHQARMIETFFSDADPERLRPTITPLECRPCDQNMPAPAPSPDAGGEAACLAHLVCPECGSVLDGGPHRPGCASAV